MYFLFYSFLMSLTNLSLIFFLLGDFRIVNMFNVDINDFLIKKLKNVNIRVSIHNNY